MILSSIMIDYVAPLFPVYTGDRLLAALCTGVFGGIGYALIYSKNSSTGGSDFIIMAVKAIKPHLSLGKIAFWSDVGIILVGGILFRDIDGIIYGTVSYTHLDVYKRQGQKNTCRTVSGKFRKKGRYIKAWLDW